MTFTSYRIVRSCLHFEKETKILSKAGFKPLERDLESQTLYHSQSRDINKRYSYIILSPRRHFLVLAKRDE